MEVLILSVLLFILLKDFNFGPIFWTVVKVLGVIALILILGPIAIGALVLLWALTQ